MTDGLTPGDRDRDEKLSQLGLDIIDQRNAGESDEELLAYLRARGCSPIWTMMVLTRALGMPLREAKELVCLSKTWADAEGLGDPFDGE